LTTTLAKPEPELLDEVLRNLLRPNLIINGGLSTPDIGLGWLYPFGSLEDLPEDEKDEKDRNANIARFEVLANVSSIRYWRDLRDDEVGDSPIACSKHLPTIEEDDEGEHDQRSPSKIGLTELFMSLASYCISMIWRLGLTLLKGKSSRLTPCARIALCQQIAAMLMPTQVKRLAIVVRLRNQLKTCNSSCGQYEKEKEIVDHSQLCFQRRH